MTNGIIFNEDCTNFIYTRYIGKIKIIPEYTKSQGYSFKIPNDGNLPPLIVVEFATTGKSYTVDHVEIRVNR